jgi:DNA-binding NtrC family response regulator
MANIRMALHELGERCGDMVGRSALMKDVFRQVRTLAAERCPVLVRGETGSGKELVARALHTLADPSSPWVALNCAAISDSLAQSELFGHERGAFTGAIAQHRGAFERADGGTLFLDEVAELSPALQAQLLRVLETHEFVRVGGDRSVRSHFRLVCATHKSLQSEVAAGRFRQDLYYRVTVAQIRVPPLRERREDIGLLARVLLARECDGECELDLEALALLEEQPWRGNVRELANVLLRARIAARGGVIDAACLQLPMGSFPYLQATTADAVLRDAESTFVLHCEGRTLAQIERDAIEHTLRSCGGSQAEAARRLGLPRQTLHDRIRKLGIHQGAART